VSICTAQKPTYAPALQYGVTAGGYHGAIVANEKQLPDETTSEETRQMTNKLTMHPYAHFIDQIAAPKGTVSKQMQYRLGLARRIKNIATDLSLEGRDNDANVLYEAVQALGGAE
jgi:hypothetical protein